MAVGSYAEIESVEIGPGWGVHHEPVMSLFGPGRFELLLKSMQGLHRNAFDRALKSFGIWWLEPG